MTKADAFDGLNCLELTQEKEAIMYLVLQRVEQNCMERGNKLYWRDIFSHVIIFRVTFSPFVKCKGEREEKEKVLQQEVLIA